MIVLSESRLRGPRRYVLNLTLSMCTSSLASASPAEPHLNIQNGSALLPRHAYRQIRLAVFQEEMDLVKLGNFGLSKALTQAKLGVPHVEECTYIPPV